METYESYIKAKQAQNLVLTELQNQLSKFPQNDMGLHIGKGFRNWQKKWKVEFKKLQEINRVGVKKFKKEILLEIENKRKNANKKTN